MTPDYSSLADNLQLRLDVISDQHLRDTNPTEQLSQLQKVSEEISSWHVTNKGLIPSQLNHYLQQSSLSKALDYLKSENLV